MKDGSPLGPLEKISQERWVITSDKWRHSNIKDGLPLLKSWRLGNHDQVAEQPTIHWANGVNDVTFMSCLYAYAVSRSIALLIARRFSHATTYTHVACYTTVAVPLPHTANNKNKAILPDIASTQRLF